MYCSGIDLSIISYLKIQLFLFSLRFPIKILKIFHQNTYQTQATTCNKTTKVVTIIMTLSSPTLILMSSLRCLLIRLLTLIVFISLASLDNFISFWILPIRESLAILDMFPYSNMMSKGSTVITSIVNQPLRYLIAIS